MIDCGVNYFALGVVVQPGDIAQWFLCYRIEFGCWVLANGFQVFLLELVLPLPPLFPCLFYRNVVGLQELVRIEGLAVIRAVEQHFKFLYAILVCQVGDKPGTIQVGVGPYLEVDSGSFGFQPHQCVEWLFFVDDCSEVHLVVWAHCSA